MSEHRASRMPGRRAQLPTTNLPVVRDALIGRDGDIATARRLLARDDVGLLTLTGAGGSGKTRLAIQIAIELLDAFDDGAFFVPLAPIRDSTLVAAVIAQTLGLPETGGRSPEDTLKEHLRDRRLLLVLDNFEHLLSAAPLISDLLAAAPGLKVLTTSRAPLRLHGEREHAVAPLALPVLTETLTPTNLGGYAAVALFMERAAAANPGLTLTNENARTVAEICVRLDGLPLALELAAVRCRVLSPSALLARLERRLTLLTGGPRDAPERHRTLRDTIAWSYDLLDEVEQRLFRQLAVFVGGSTLAAVEDIVAPLTDHRGAQDAPMSVNAESRMPSTLDMMASLVDKSLLRQEEDPDGEPRFTMLETIREYALERLATSGEESGVRRRHLRWITAVALRADLKAAGDTSVTWLDGLTVEMGNARAALAWSLIDLDPVSADDGLCLAGWLQSFWYFRDQLREGRRWLQQVLARDRELSERGDVSGPRASRSDATWDANRQRGRLGNHPRVRALNALSYLNQQLGTLDEAEARAEEALVYARGVGDQLGEAQAQITLGTVKRSSGEYELAIQLCEAALMTCRRLDDQYGIWRALDRLGETSLRLGAHEQARTYIEEALTVARAAGNWYGEAADLQRLGVLDYHQGNLDRATTQLEAGLAILRRVRARGQHTALLDLGRVALAQGDLHRAATCFAESLGLCRDAGDRYNAARCLEGLAGVSSAAGAAGEAVWSAGAACLLGAVDTLRHAINFAVAPVERPAVEQAEALARTTLGDADFEAARSQGRSLTLDQAVERATELSHRIEATRPARATSAASSPPSAFSHTLPLTAREQEVAALIARGLSNRQIANELIISERTVHVHVASILSKLAFRSRAQVAVWAAEHGLMPGRET